MASEPSSTGKSPHLDAMESMPAEFKKAMEGSLKGGDLQMTSEEVKKFQAAFDEPEFRKLLSEYMDEISDPAHRAEQEAYIRQLEADNKVPTNKELIHPMPGFVVKTHRSGGGAPAEIDREKIFINIVGHERMEEPTSMRTDQGENWRLPYSLGPRRVEQDKRGGVVPTQDICFHPTAVLRAQAEQRFRDLIVQTAIEAWEEAAKKVLNQEDKLERAYHVLRGVAYKNGTPATMVLSKAADGGAAAAAEDEGNKENEGAAQSSAAGAKADPGASPTKPKGAAAKTTAAKPMKKGFINEKAAKAKAARGPLEPRYSITYRGQFDMQDHIHPTGGDVSVVSRPRPRQLVIKIEVPKVKKAGDMELDVAEKEIKFKSGLDYELNLALPYPVVESEGAAKFDKANKTLQITVPVQPESDEERAERMAREAEVLRRAGNGAGAGAAVAPARTGELEDPDEQEDDDEEEEADATEEEAARTAAAAKAAAAKREESKAKAKKENSLAKELGITPLASLPKPPKQERKPAAQAAAPPKKAPAEASRPPAKAAAPAALLEQAAAGVKYAASSAFQGALPGYVFQRGSQGVGYYQDKRSAPE
eukprot:CAMPEP_0118872412 /NCGR_PEP_ID=MMETSP1163-20130328/14613_1 /TAXON_ID=124430 /ORGANISM="Phaeomonas parva, Strain CCMP2877" /LENGTH=591 /DNA_ID=CAMNT_0006807595 /DNA_START=83 /DNA_END=1855 /DNA_ORIENTATION=+